MKGLALKVPPVLVVIVCGYAMWLLARYLPTLELTVLFRVGASIMPIAAAVLLMVLAERRFHAVQTTVNPHKPHTTRALVTDGPFRFSRNPIYLSFLLALIGWAIFLSSLFALLVCPLFVFYLSRFQIQAEERVLESLFGQRYLDYKKRVRRWL